MNLYLSIFIFFSSLGYTYDVHEFHVSKCLVEYKAEREEIQVSMNIFIDDLEVGLAEMGVDNLYIGTEKESSSSEKYINTYLKNTFSVGVNDTEPVSWQFIGKETSEDLSSIWCYMSISAPEDIEKIYVKNSILLETYEDQKNITNIIGPNSEKTSFMGHRGSDDKTISY